MSGSAPGVLSTMRVLGPADPWALRLAKGMGVGGSWDDLSMLDRGDLPDFGKVEAWETLRANRTMRARLDVDDLLIAAHLAGLYDAVTLPEATKGFRP